MCPVRIFPAQGTKYILDFLETHSLAARINFNDDNIASIIFTLRGPVLSSVHSEADSFICSLGSNQETAKYIEMDIVCNYENMFFYLLILS